MFIINLRELVSSFVRDSLLEDPRGECSTNLTDSDRPMSYEQDRISAQNFVSGDSYSR